MVYYQNKEDVDNAKIHVQKLNDVNTNYNKGSAAYNENERKPEERHELEEIMKVNF